MTQERVISKAAPWLFTGFGVMVTLSGVQLYVQELASGGPAAFAAIFVANLVAALPWLPLSFAILGLTERFPPDRLAGFGVHAAMSAVLSVGFLSWLALFHLFMSAGSMTFRAYLAWLRLDLGEFFTVSLLVYWFVAAAGVAIRMAAGRDTDRSQLEPASSTSSDETQFLVIRSLGRSQLVDPATVDWIEAEGSYVRLHVGSRSYLLRRSMKELAESLGGAGFARIHRSAIVNLARVVEVRPRTHGDALIVLSGGSELKVSRTFRAALAQLGL